MAQARMAKAAAARAHEKQLRNEEDFCRQRNRLKEIAALLERDRRFSETERRGVRRGMEEKRSKYAEESRLSDAGNQGEKADVVSTGRSEEQTYSRDSEEGGRRVTSAGERSDGDLEELQDAPGKTKEQTAEDASRRAVEDDTSHTEEQKTQQRQQTLSQPEVDTRERENQLRQLQENWKKCQEAIGHELARQLRKVRQHSEEIKEDEARKHLNSIRRKCLRMKKEHHKHDERAEEVSISARRGRLQTHIDPDLQQIVKTSAAAERYRCRQDHGSRKGKRQQFRRGSLREEDMLSQLVSRTMKGELDQAVSELRQSTLATQRSSRVIDHAPSSRPKKKKLHITTDGLAMLRSAAVTQVQLDMDEAYERDAFHRGYIGTLWIWIDLVKGVNPLRLSFGDTLFVVVRCPTQEHQWQKWQSGYTANFGWDESCTFRIRYKRYPNDRFLRLELWKKDSRHQGRRFLGEAQVPFPGFETRWDGYVQLCWNTLLGGDRIDLDCGQLHLGLKFSLSESRQGRHPQRTDRGMQERKSGSRHGRKQVASKGDIPRAGIADEAVQVDCATLGLVEQPDARPSVVPPREMADESVQVDYKSLMISSEPLREPSCPPAVPLADDSVQVESPHLAEEVPSLSHEKGSNRGTSCTYNAPFPMMTEEELDVMVPAALAQMDEYAKGTECLSWEMVVDVDNRVLASNICFQGCRLTCSNRLCGRTVRNQDLRDLFEEEEFRAWGLCSVCQRAIFHTVCPCKPPKTVVIGKAHGKPYSELRLYSSVPVAFPDFTVVWPSTGHLFIAQGFSRFELQERIRRCSTETELKAVLNAPLLRYFLRNDWKSFMNHALRMCLNLKVDQHPRLQLLLSATGESPICCFDHADAFDIVAGEICGHATAVGEILMDKRSEFQ
ncbi:hypothetical protein BESB_049750 [Besnoitia besnoiti]|uniref:C2 domain-containing protein n=1 Tax=Besnoitia besnoiti TaxID=94643 RepID=A0A2A9MM00_BESBE|nr:hypothetical protein BESB_049750 [Besnoitia besnoiti]PFH36783.1 hypothetical protein BESB_049750 [Besnoitia besnoiti]